MFTKTVDSITKVFTQAIKDLESLEQSQSQLIANNDLAVQKLEEASAYAVAEKARAENVRMKLQAIVSN